jgi:NADH-quinone oxidoreductase subunit H
MLSLPVLMILLVAVVYTGISLKITARIDRRYGPPIYQPIIDLVKLVSLRSNVSHGTVFELGLLAAIASSSVTLLMIPMGGIHPLSGSGDLLVILYLMIFSSVTLGLSAGASENPNSSLGVARKLMLGLGYEVPLILILLSMMTHYHTTSLLDIVRAQQGSGLWGVAAFPLLAVAAILILPALEGIRPFDITIAPQEVATGPMVELGGKFLALWVIEHSLQGAVTLSLMVDLFFGGATNLGIFILKMTGIFLLGVLINAVYPRFRLEQALKYFWRWPTLFALAGLIVVLVTRGA